MTGRILLVFTILPILCLAGVSAGLVTKCKLDDSKCIKESSQLLIPVFAKGLPEYNVKTMDPINFTRIDATTSNLKLILTDISMTGLKDSVVKKIKYDSSNKKFFMKLLYSCQLESQYEMDGQLLILSLKGKGALHVTLRKMELSIEVDVEKIQKEGALYWNIKDWKYSFVLKDKSDIVFENLFSGNEILGRAANEVISSSGNDIILETGPAIVKTIAAEVVNNINNFFQHVPIKDLSIE